MKRRVGEPEPARASEARLAELLRDEPIGAAARVFCVTPGRGQLAFEVAAAAPERVVTLAILDRWHADAALAAAGGAQAPANLRIECAAELPAGPFDVALLPLRAGADSELAWELLHHACCALAPGGRLWASVDEPRDRWVAGRMDELFGGRVRRVAASDAVVYSGVRRAAPRRNPVFEHEFAFRDRGRLVRAISRPGVFSHRRLDLGARALLESLSDVGENGLEREYVASGARVLDYGCGAGAVGIAAGLCAPGVRVHFADSMPRAVDCALRGAAANGLAGCTGEVCVDGRVGGGPFDLALLNPPYYSQHRIAEVFASAAQRALRKGGRAHFVTRQPEWFVERLKDGFERVRVRELRGYSVVCGVRR